MSFRFSFSGVYFGFLIFSWVSLEMKSYYFVGVFGVNLVAVFSVIGVHKKRYEVKQYASLVLLLQLYLQVIKFSFPCDSQLDHHNSLGRFKFFIFPLITNNGWGRFSYNYLLRAFVVSAEAKHYLLN